MKRIPQPTSAPWTTESDGSLSFGGQIIATPETLKPDHAPREEGLANALLISATHDLLESAVILCAWVESRVAFDPEWLEKQASALQMAYRMADFAINKAHGRTK